MHTATPAQSSFINALAIRAGYASPIEAADEYGLGLRRPGDLTVREASDLIEWLKAGGERRAEMSIDLAAHSAEAAAQQTAAIEAQRAAGAALIARQVSEEAERARLDTILAERGLGHLAGAEKREARRLLRRELEAA